MILIPSEIIDIAVRQQQECFVVKPENISSQNRDDHRHSDRNKLLKCRREVGNTP